MLESPTIQKTIYLYWINYKEFSDIQEAVKFAQKIYLEHKPITAFIQHYQRAFQRNKEIKTS